MDEERIIDGRVRAIVLPTPERAAKGDLTVEETARGGVHIRVKRAFNDPLRYYARNGHLTDDQKHAGLRFYALWYRGAFQVGYALMRYGERAGNPPPDRDGHARSQEEYHFARKAIRGSRGKEIALRVCCYGEKAGRRGQMELLRLALDDLVRHFEELRRKSELDRR